jgi:hypothetical protein
LIDAIRPDSGADWVESTAVGIPGGAVIVHDHRGSSDTECDIALHRPVQNQLGYVVQNSAPCEEITVAYNVAQARQAAVFQARSTDRLYYKPLADLANAGPEHALGTGTEPILAAAGTGFTLAYRDAQSRLAVHELDADGQPIAGAQVVAATLDRFWLGTDGVEARLTWAIGATATTMRLCR